MSAIPPWKQPIEYNAPEGEGAELTRHESAEDMFSHLDARDADDEDADEAYDEPEVDPDEEESPTEVPEHHPADAPNQPEYPVKKSREAAGPRLVRPWEEDEFQSNDTEPMDYDRGPNDSMDTEI